MTDKLTPAQKKWLIELTKGRSHRPYHDNFRVWDRVMDVLHKKGLAVPYVHGGYEITEAGSKLADTLPRP